MDHSEHTTEGEGLKRALSWPSFHTALRRSEMGKGVGVDGYNSYLLLRSPEWVQRNYWLALTQMIEQKIYPPEYHEWVAILLSKGVHENPRDITRRRDIHMTCHGQKLIVRMLTNEYERAAREHVPSSQAGYGSRRSTLEQVLVLRLAQQQAKIKGTDLYIGFQDFQD